MLVVHQYNLVGPLDSIGDMRSREENKRSGYA